jgi:hypothetical protein
MAYVGTPIEVGNQFSSLVGKRFSGDASTTAFTLDVRANSALDIEVFVENVRQDPNSAYTVDGTTLTFTAAPPSGTNNIYVVHQAPTVASVSPTAGSVTASSFDNSVISGHTALAATPADTDEFLVSDAGTIKRIDYSYIKVANTPAFFAVSATNQSISHNTWTKLVFGTETLDSDSKFADSRFTPTVAGYYQLTLGTYIPNVDSAEIAQISFYKNGSDYQYGKHYHQGNDADGDRFLSTTAFFYLDADDYVEGYVYHNEGGAQNATAANTFMSGFRVIGV